MITALAVGVLLAMTGLGVLLTALTSEWTHPEHQTDALRIAVACSSCWAVVGALVVVVLLS